MKKHIKILSILSVPFFALGIHFGVKNTTNIEKAEAISATETVYWGYKNNNLYLAANETTEIAGCTNKGTISGNISDFPGYHSLASNINEVTIQNRIAPSSYYGYFGDCKNLQKFNNINNLDTSKATDFTYMFGNASYKGGTLDLSTFRTPKAESMLDMFFGFKGSVNISNFDTSNVSMFANMFYEFEGNVDVSSFSIKSGAYAGNMFFASSGIDTIRFKEINLIGTDVDCMFDEAQINIVDFSNAVTNGTISKYLFEYLENCTIVLPELTSLKGVLGNICYDNTTLVLPQKTMPEFNRDDGERSALDGKIKNIYVYPSLVSSYQNDGFFSDWAGKFKGAYFMDVQINGYGKFVAEGYSGNYFPVSDFAIDPDVLYTLTPSSKSVLSANPISIVDSNNQPIEVDNECCMFTMPEDNIKITVNFERTGNAYAFAKTFLQETGDVCSAVGGPKLILLQGIWGDLVTAYNQLDSEDKDTIEDDVTDINIAAMLERYSYILSKYNTETTKNLTEFIDGFTITYNARDSFIKTEDFDTTLVLLISIISAAGLLTILLTNKKRKLY